MHQVPLLTPDPSYFPALESAHDTGLLALGGDLSPQRLLTAYQKGIFPWYTENQPIMWFSPNPRAILNLSDLKISQSLKKSIKNGGFVVKADTNFSSVISACRAPRDLQIKLGEVEAEHDTDTWITPDLMDAFHKLHTLGYAHSIESYIDDRLVGGLYGLSIGRAFFGESMFHTQSDASKIALVGLVSFLKSKEFSFIDCQVYSDHLGSLGAKTIPRYEFVGLLKIARVYPTLFGPWQLNEKISDMVY